MGLLDDDYTPRFQPKDRTGHHRRSSDDTQQDRDEELNNLGREEVTEDFSDSPHADRV